MDKNKKIDPLLKKHICKKCGKESWMYCVHELNPDCPCLDCQLKELGRR